MRNRVNVIDTAGTKIENGHCRKRPLAPSVLRIAYFQSGSHSVAFCQASTVRGLPIRWQSLLESASSRGVAQPGRALSSGGRGREFKSRHPDQYFQLLMTLFCFQGGGRRSFKSSISPIIYCFCLGQYLFLKLTTLS